MSNPSKYGRTETPVTPLEEFVCTVNPDFDSSGVVYGRTETPVVHLTPFTWDLSLQALIERMREFTSQMNRIIDQDVPSNPALTQQIRAQLNGVEQELVRFENISA